MAAARGGAATERAETMAREYAARRLVVQATEEDVATWKRTGAQLTAEAAFQLAPAAT
ncbi:MAG: hypothetical protein ABI831_02935 [Betaproteobacteria bacterium]